jgi:cytochrome c peroxidase
MGFSGAGGDPDFATLIARLSALEYYRELFKFAFGSEEITESKMQIALGQFIRSIQSFDSKFDVGRQAAGANNANFANFTAQENQGKNLFLAPRDLYRFDAHKRRAWVRRLPPGARV